MTSLLITVLMVPLLFTEGVGEWSHVDDSIFASDVKIAQTMRFDTLPIGERVAAFGKLFLGTPYVAGTIDIDTTHEHLVINLHGLDCVTFYENSLALAMAIHAPSGPTKGDFEVWLTNLRYRGGIRNGYHSRLHYTTDYFYDAVKKGVMSNETSSIGFNWSGWDDRPINFMTEHRSLYPQLSHSDAEYAAMKKVEHRISARKGFRYIDKNNIMFVENGIHTGDILGITTNNAGLDCSHTGIAIRMPDGRIHFMHASSLGGKVIISEEPLAGKLDPGSTMVKATGGLLSHSSHQTGVIVMRPIQPKND